MIRIAALNDSSSEIDSDEAGPAAIGRREAEESEAYTLYNKALSLQRQDVHKAEDAFEQLLSHGFIREAAKLIETETEGAVHPGLQLLYSIYKNLASMSLQKGDHEAAMEWFIEAVKVDESETTVWYKIGTIALKLHNYQLARLGFEQGLQCNPNHWPCLDNVITVLYTINDYWYCLYYISKALKKDYLYSKGIVLRNQIFQEQPSLREDTKEMFIDCNPSVNTEIVDQEDIDEFINEALEMRKKRRELARVQPTKPNKLPVPIKAYTWQCVGESLLELYETIRKSNPPMSMGLRVDLSDYAPKEVTEVDDQQSEVQNSELGSSNASQVDLDKRDSSVSREVDKDKMNTSITSQVDSDKKDTVTSCNVDLDDRDTSDVIQVNLDKMDTPGNSEENMEVDQTVSTSMEVDRTVSTSITAPSENTEKITTTANTNQSVETSFLTTEPREPVEVIVIPENSTENVEITSVTTNLSEAAETITTTANLTENIETYSAKANPKESVEMMNTSGNDRNDNSVSGSGDVTMLSTPETTQFPSMTHTTPEISSTVSTTHSTSIPISVALALQDHPGSEVSDMEGKSKGQKRKRVPTFEDPIYGKRRSARVRSTFTRKEEERINFKELLFSFFPSSLKPGVEEEDTEMFDLETEHSNLPFPSIKAAEIEVETMAKKISVSEENDVREFLEKQQKNAGTIFLMLHFLEALAEKSELVWSQELVSIYIRIYTRLRRHMDLPCLLSKEESDDYIRTMGRVCLLNAEFHLDQWLIKQSKMGGSPRGRSPGMAVPELPKYWQEDMWYILGLIGQSEVLGSQWLPHCIRVYWMKARLCLLQGTSDEASCCFHKAKEFLKWLTEEESQTVITLLNCRMDNVISKEKIEQQEDSLKRSQSLEETQKFYAAGEYSKVVELLIKTLTQPNQKFKLPEAGSVIPERIEQLLLLQDCLYRMDEHQRGLEWGEVAFYEALQGYKKATTSPHKDEWCNAMVQIWTALLMNFKKSNDCIQSLSSNRKVRLAHSLVFVIDTMMSVPEKATDMPIGSLLPWMVLHAIIHYEESKINDLQMEQSSHEKPSEENLPSSLMLLNIAHEYLGRHSWCTKSEGALLTYFMDILKREMEVKVKLEGELRQLYEQCVYCLYGHPNKKGKARHLFDHNAPTISLKFQQAMELFEYYKPKTLPEFDSFKTDTVSAELENFLRRIAQMVPEQEKPSKMIDKLQDYIDGNTNVVPVPEKEDFSTLSRELYYLLGDYYFKNNEHTKAMKFYMYDICINPQRLDSWAGLALARMSHLEQKLNSMELRLDLPVHKKSIAALRSFRRAVELEDAYGKLWMEYGSLSYQLHAHSSRQLQFHQEKMRECDEEFLTEELLQNAKDYRQEMLQLAYNCYKYASQCVDEESEEWLTQYMMGKCMEKMNKSHKEYLEHYKLAAAALHDENATYPKKIAYAYTAHTSPRLAVEALEMFYRLHVSILKLLLGGQNSSEYQMYDQYIQEAAESPFAKGCEKKNENSEGCNMGSDTGELGKSTTSQQDHTYSKQKNAANVMQNILDAKSENQAALDSADSMDEKIEDSANNSRDSSEYFPSAESDAESSQERQILDTMVINSMSSTLEPSSKDELFSSSKMMELSAEVLYSDMSLTSSPSSHPKKPNYLKAKEDSQSCLISSPSYYPKKPDYIEAEEDSQSSQTASEKMVKQTSLGFSVTENQHQEAEKSETKSDISIAEEKLEKKQWEMEKSETKSDISIAEEKLEKKQQEMEKSDAKTDRDIISDKTKYLDNTAVKKSDSKEKVEVIEIFSSPEPLPNTSNAFFSNLKENDKEKTAETEELEEVDMDIREKSKVLVSNDSKDRVKKEEHQKDEFPMDTDIENIPASSVSLDNNMDTDHLEAAPVVQDSDIGRTCKTQMPGDTAMEPENEHDLVMKSHVNVDVDMKEENKTTMTEEVKDLLYNKDEKEEAGGAGKIISKDVTKITQDCDEGQVLDSSIQDHDLGCVSSADVNTTPGPDHTKVLNSNVSCGDVKTTQDPGHIQVINSSVSSADVTSTPDPDHIQVINSSVSSADAKTTPDPDHIQALNSSVSCADVKTTQDRDHIQVISSSVSSADAKITQDLDQRQSPVSKISIEEEQKSTRGIVPMEVSVDERQTPDASDQQDGVKSCAMPKENQSEENKMESSLEKMAAESEKQPTKEITPIDSINEGGKSETKMDTMSERDSDKPQISSETDKGTTVSEVKLEGEALHKDLIEKCMAALHLCLSRFPTHYKSMYRLAYIYYHSPYHRNLKFARDLLLGTSRWQETSYMPAQGLFSERKANNFFQGTWRLPINEVERTGSFATHLNRAVLLLLKILREQADVTMLYSLHLQFNRTPEAEKKYLRDGERLHYAKVAFSYCLDAIKGQISKLRELTDKDRAVKHLMETYKIYNYALSKMKATYGPRVNNLLAATYKAALKEQVDYDRPLLEQAIKFCQNHQQQQALLRQAQYSSSLSSMKPTSVNLSSKSPNLQKSTFFPAQQASSSLSLQKTSLMPSQLSSSNPSLQKTSLIGGQPSSSNPGLQKTSLMAGQPSSSSPSLQRTPLTPNQQTLNSPNVQKAIKPTFQDIYIKSNTEAAQCEESSAANPSVVSIHTSPTKSANQSAVSKHTSPTKSAKQFMSVASFMSSVIEDELKSQSEKTKLPSPKGGLIAHEISPSADEPIAPLVTPPTPAFQKSSPDSKEHKAPVKSLSLSKPSTKRFSAEVIEISSDEDEVQKSAKGQEGQKSTDEIRQYVQSVDNGLEKEKRQVQSANDKSEEDKTQCEETSLPNDKKTQNEETEEPPLLDPYTGLFKTESSEKLPLLDPSTGLLSDGEDKEKKRTALLDPYTGLLCDTETKKEDRNVMLDPYTGLMIESKTDSKDMTQSVPTAVAATDSDSQNSVYVANPENISFEDELMVEDV